MSDYKVVVSDHTFPNLKPEREILEPLGAEVIEKQCQSLEEFLPFTKDADALLVTYLKPIGEEIFRVSPKLRVVVRYAIGIDTIDIPAATRYGIMVANVPDYCLEEVSDHAVALLYTVARKIVISDQKARSGNWNLLFLKPTFKVRGQTLGFLGFGRIAQMVATKLAGSGFRFIFYDPYINNERIENAQKVSLEEVLKQSDFLSVHAPETKETKHILNRHTLALMKPTAYIINTARGGLVETDALVEMLTSKRLAGAALDVIEDAEPISSHHALCKLDNVILTPHSAWYSEQAEPLCQTTAAQEVARVLRGEPPKALLNPEVLNTERARKNLKEIPKAV